MAGKVPVRPRCSNRCSSPRWRTPISGPRRHTSLSLRCALSTPLHEVSKPRLPTLPHSIPRNPRSIHSLRVPLRTSHDILFLFLCRCNPDTLPDAVGHVRMDTSLRYPHCQSRGTDTLLLSTDPSPCSNWGLAEPSWSSQPVLQLHPFPLCIAILLVASSLVLLRPPVALPSSPTFGIG